jgi:CRP-like cAMP-binding protein
MYVNGYCPTNPIDKTSSCLSCQHRKFSLIDDLFREELALLDSHRKKVFFKKGTIIFRENSKPAGLICLSKGSVKLTKIGTEGIERIVGLKAPVDFLGHESLITNELHASTATALENCQICFIDTEDFFSVLKSNPAFAIKLLQSFAHGIMSVEERIVNLTQKHMKARIAEALLIIKDKFGLAADQKSLALQLKRAEFGALSYMTTSNAIRILSGLADEGLIRLQGKSIQLLDIPSLEKISALNI